MIDISNPRLYQLSLRELVQHKRQSGREFRGRFIQIFLALKLHQNELPSMISNQFVSTEVLQTMIDDVYAKSSRPADDCVLMLFEERYHARTGLISPGNTTPQNTWRNNFNLQKGVGCYAPQADLASQTFLNEPRHRCKYLVAGPGGGISGGQCQLSHSGATYRNEEHRKWLRIEATGGGYAVVDLMNISNFQPYIAPNGNRIPLLPLMIALHHDAVPGLPLGLQPAIDTPDFASVFHFSAEELAAYFEDDPDNPRNRAVLIASGEREYTRIGAYRVQPQRVARRPQAGARMRTGTPPAPILVGTPTAPPGVNTGWEAEQFVASALRNAGWTAYDVSRQRLGYDLLAQRGRDTRYVDVKSSLGLCSPTLTSREWQQARAHADAYVLAIVENFNPSGENVIFWVADPASNCQARQCTTIEFSIARGSWVYAAVPLTRI